MSGNKTVIIGVGYKMYSGKDTVADYWDINYNTTRVSFAAKLKSMVRDLYGLTDEQTDGSDKLIPIPGYGDITPREIMQRFGNDNRLVYSDIWVDYVFNKTIPDLPAGTIGVFTDCRFKNEADKIKNIGGTMVNVIRDTSHMKIDPKFSTHPSETSLDGYDFDYTIQNGGSLEDLYKKADIVMNSILTKRGHIITDGEKNRSAAIQN